MTSPSLAKSRALAVVGSRVSSVCPHDCASVCALEAETASDGGLKRIRGSRGNRYTDGIICAKVARYAERLHHPDRLLQPLQRTGAKGDGGFRPIAWADALDEIAGAFQRATARYGAEAVWPYYYAGTMGLVQRDGINRLRHVMNYSGQLNSICSMAAKIGWNAGAGQRWGVDANEIAKSEVVVLWGLNAVATQVQLMDKVAKARRTNDAKLIVVDPYRSPTAALADMHLPLRPGTDAALACGVMHVLFKEGLADRAYMERFADDPAGLERHLESRDPVWAASITGLKPEQIVEFARLYGSTHKSFVRLGFGFTRSRNGAISMHAASCLPAVTGAWQVEGGGALYNQGDLYGIDTTLIEGADALDSAVRVLDMSRIGPVLVGDKRDLDDGPPVAAMLVQNTNPACVAPESDKVLEGLARADLFVAVHEHFMTDTAKLADIVLPATMFLEHDDIYTASGHTILQVGPKRFDPPGETRENHAVVVELAKRLGAEHAGFSMSALELIDATLELSGYPGAQSLIDNEGYDAAPSFERAHFLDGFPTPSGRFRFKADWAAQGARSEGLPDFPDHVAIIDGADADHPFRLVAGPAREFLNSTFSETATSQKKEKRPTLQVHPSDAAALGIGEGEPVRVGNERGSVLLWASIRNGALPGTLVVESIWPNAAYPEGVGINRLTSAEPAVPEAGAVFHDTAVWLKREEPEAVAAS